MLLSCFNRGVDQKQDIFMKLFTHTFGVAGVALAMFAAPALAHDTFPVTIEHALGTTVIEAQPERIVTIGWMSQDSVLALGVVPVGIPFSAWGGDENGFYPWVRAKLDELGQGDPAMLNYNDGIPFEDILATAPDLILARYSGLTQDEYDRLSTIAPVVAYAGEPWSGEWRDIVRTNGKALGRSADAEALVAATDAQIAEVSAAHPEFEGKTFSFAGGLSGDAGALGIYVSTDPRVQLVEDIGLTLAEGVKALPIDQGFNFPVSLENLSSVDADVFIAWLNDESALDFVQTNPLMSRYRPVAEGRFIPLIDRAFVMATSAPSPLAIPYALDTLVPAIADVLK